MKKIYSILLTLILLISTTSIVLAGAGDDKGNHFGKDDDFEGDNDQNETEKEIEIVNNTFGAEIRLLQLEKALLKNILKGEMAVQVLIGLNFTTTELESILIEMKALLEEVRQANASSNASVEIFVFLKNESKNFTTQFRETIRGLLNDTSLSELRVRIKEMLNASGQLDDYNKRIKNLIRTFNGNQLYRLYSLIGEANSLFVNQYLNGTLPLNETKLQLCKIINEMTKEKKYEIFLEIKGENIRRQIHAQDVIENIGNGHGKQ